MNTQKPGLKPQFVLPVIITLAAAAIIAIVFGIDNEFKYHILIIMILLIFGAFLRMLFYHQKSVHHRKCKHDHWGLVIDGFQYCVGCGIAKRAPQIVCEHHIDEIMEKIEVPNNKQTTAERLLDINAISEVIYINRCEQCGRIDKVNIKISE